VWLGNRISSERLRLGLSVPHVAEKARVTPAQWRSFERGTLRATAREIDYILQALGVSLGALLNLSNLL